MEASWVEELNLPSTMLSPDDFIFTGERGGLERGWNDPGKTALWTYNLHYFDDLRRAEWRKREDWHAALVSRWIAENPPVQGAGWEPYPTSQRIVNWIVWSLAGGQLSDASSMSLANQADWLSRNLETHLLGNHLFANLKALTFAGCYFDGALADRWLATALDRLGHELNEQVLPDGGNFELSPMYHAIFLNDLLDLVNLSSVFPERIPDALQANLRATAGRMLGWLEAMTHPDGEIAQFNDAAIGVAPTFAQLKTYAGALSIDMQNVGRKLEHGGVTAHHLPASGYVRLQCEGAVAICDVACVGPDYLPGHAHADTLSYELSVGERRIVVNGGTSRYGNDSERLRERSTVSHSTVEVAGRPSSEVWSGFRVARRARPFDISLEPVDGGVRLSAAHDGYKRLAGAPVHRRRWTMRSQDLLIQDYLTGQKHDAVARHLLHPNAAANLPEGISYAARELSETHPARHAPTFGVVLETLAIAIPLADGTAEIRWRWG